MANDRFAFPRSELRSRAARGAIINGAFLIAVESLGLIQAIVVARLLDADQIGLYGIVSVTVMTLLSLKQIGIDEAFVQQEQDDQVEAFQHAFTLDLALSAGFALLTAALAPLIGHLYGDSSLVPLMLALSLLPVLFALQAPAWVFLRRMDFVRQRALQAIVPAVTLAATVAALLADLGAWSLVIGALTGNAAAAVMAAVISPYPIRIKLHGKAARRYLTFSAPIFLAAVCGLVIRQGQTFAFEAKLGLAGVGYLTLAVTLTRYADRADQLITQTIYPAICAIADKPARMAEAFEKSNRLTAMWALPFGATLALFTPDLIAHVLGPKWVPATALIQLIGVSTAIYQLGFNWTAFHRAVGRTRPQTVYAIAGLIAFLAVPCRCSSPSARAASAGDCSPSTWSPGHFDGPTCAACFPPFAQAGSWRGRSFPRCSPASRSWHGDCWPGPSRGALPSRVPSLPSTWPVTSASPSPWSARS